MTIDEFTKVTTEIENFYQKEISDEQKKIWFSELKGMDLRRFKYVISQVYRSCKFLPKLADIVEINTNLGYSQLKKEEATIKCKKCKNTGYITYWKNIKNGEKEISVSTYVYHHFWCSIAGGDFNNVRSTGTF